MLAHAVSSLYESLLLTAREPSLLLLVEQRLDVLSGDWGRSFYFSVYVFYLSYADFANRV
jgi:hypothetical protein